MEYNIAEEPLYLDETGNQYDLANSWKGVYDTSQDIPPEPPPGVAKMSLNDPSEEGALKQGWAKINGQWASPEQLKSPETLPKMYRAPEKEVPPNPQGSSRPAQDFYQQAVRIIGFDPITYDPRSEAQRIAQSNQDDYLQGLYSKKSSQEMINRYNADRASYGREHLTKEETDEAVIKYNTLPMDERRTSQSYINRIESDLSHKKQQGMQQLAFMMAQFEKDQAANKPVSLAEGAMLARPTGEVLASNPKVLERKSMTPTEMLRAAAQGDPTALKMVEIEKQTSEAKAKATAAARGEVQVRDIDVPLLKDLPKQKADAALAVSRVEQYKTLSEMADKGAGGLSGGLKSILAPVAEAMGVDSKDMSESQAYQLMARAGVGKMRLELVGSGQVSNFEQDLMQRLSGGSIKTSREAAQKLFDYYAKESQRVIDNYNTTIGTLGAKYPDVASSYRKIGGGGDKIIVKDSKGRRFQLPKSQLNDAIKQGYMEVK